MKKLDIKTIALLALLIVLTGCSQSNKHNNSSISGIMLKHGPNARVSNPLFNFFEKSEFNFYDEEFNIIDTKKYSGRYWQLTADSDFFYIFSTQKYIRIDAKTHEEKEFEFSRELNAIDMTPVVYDGNIYLIDNAGFRPEPIYYKSIIYKNTEAFLEIDGETIDDLAADNEHIFYVSNKENGQHAEQKEVAVNIYNQENQEMVSKVISELDGYYYSKPHIIDSKFYLYAYMPDDLITSDASLDKEDVLIEFDSHANIVSMNYYSRISPNFNSGRNYEVSDNSLYLFSDRYEVRRIDLNSKKIEDLQLDLSSLPIDQNYYRYWNQHSFDFKNNKLYILNSYRDSETEASLYTFDLKSGNLNSKLEVTDIGEGHGLVINVNPS